MALTGRFCSSILIGFHSRSCCFRRKFINMYPILIQAQSHRHTLPPNSLPDVITTHTAQEFVMRLDDNSRSLLLQELQSCAEPESQKSKEPDKPSEVTWQQLRDVFLFNGIPFIGFGFLDNALMIVAGEYIDAKICVALGLSTMAAAAWGNLISDIAGVGCAGYVEMLAHKIGVHPVPLSKEQAIAWSTRWTIALGRSLGLFVGCLIGMVPLLFYNTNHKSDIEDSHSHDAT